MEADSNMNEGRGFCNECYFLEKEVKRLEQLYSELLMAVQTKHPNESRHETALRYIKKAENPTLNQGTDQTVLNFMREKHELT